MAVQLTYAGEMEWNNAKALLFKATFTGNYGVNGVGDLLNFAPTQAAGDGGVLDPSLVYNNILAQPPQAIGVFNESLAGGYVQPKPNAVPTLKNAGLQVYAAGGAEKGTGVAYTAAELAGSVTLIVVMALQ